jgi:hypothetical protein
LILALVVAVVAAGEVQAHRLKAACQLLPSKVVRVESWFDNGEKPTKGHVQVRGANGQVLLEGQLNREGVFQFKEPEAPASQVVVEAGEGHRAEVVIHPADPNSAEHFFPIKDVLIGLLLLLAAAALVLSLRNAQALRHCQREQ